MPTAEALPQISDELSMPTAVAIGADEKIYVAEPNLDRIQVFDSAGQYQATLSGLDVPTAVAVSADGLIYVGNAGTGSVEIYGANMVRTAVLGAGDGEFMRPTGIALDSNGLVYVADGRANRVKVYNPDNSLKFSFGSTGTGAGQFQLPTGIAVNEATSEILVPDLMSLTDSARVQVFDLNGVYKRSFETRGLGDKAFIRPLGIAVDTLDRIYISDAFQNVVTVYSSAGGYLGNIYDADHPLRNPMGMAFAPGTSRLFVASLNTGSVETYGIDANYSDIEVSPLVYDFGSVAVGSRSAIQTFNVTNAGSGDLAVDTVTLSGVDASDFSIQSDGCANRTIAPGSGCVVDVLFAPASSGSKSASLSIASNDLYVPVLNVALSGASGDQLYVLTVAKSGSGSGQVQAQGINCGADCSESYVAGSMVTLSAAPSSGSVFDGWSGGGCSGTATCVVTLDQDVVVTAAFSAIPVTPSTYTVTASAGDNGSISPAGAVTANAGATLTFTIAADANYHIDDVKVDGASVGAVDSYSFANLSADHTIEAKFASDILRLSTLAIGEVTVDHNWKRVTLGRVFTDPIVVAKPSSLDDAEPAVVRVRNVNATGFEIRIQEWDYLDDIHGEERVSYIVMERGSHTLADGTRVEAGQFSTGNVADFGSVSFARSLTAVPVVMTSITSFNEGDAVAGRIRNISTSGFEYKLQEQEDNAPGHAVETVSYIAWEPSLGTLDGVGFEVARTGDVVSHLDQSISFNGGYASEPLFIADMQTFNDADTANLRWRDKSAQGISVRVDEERSQDDEVVHAAEDAGYLVLVAPGQPNALLDTDGDGLLDADETSIYNTDPQAADSDGDGLMDGEEVNYWGVDWAADYDGDGLINLLDADSDGDGHDDGVEQANGTDPADPDDPEPVTKATSDIIAIGEVDVTHEWQQVVLSRTFVDPLVVAKPASLNDTAPAVVRVRNVNPTGFEVRIQEWDYLDGIHAEERVSYIVMERGSHVLADGTRIEAGRFDTANVLDFGSVSFSQRLNTTPVVTTGIMSFNEGQAVTGRIRNISVNGFEYQLQEQEDNAPGHAAETVSYIAWEPSLGTLDGVSFEVGRTGNVVSHLFRSIYFNGGYSTEPLFIADMQTANDGDTANLRWRDKSAHGVSIQVDEEQSQDGEVQHATEYVGYLVLAPPAESTVSSVNYVNPDQADAYSADQQTAVAGSSAALLASEEVEDVADSQSSGEDPADSSDSDAEGNAGEQANAPDAAEPAPAGPANTGSQPGATVTIEPVSDVTPVDPAPADADSGSSPEVSPGIMMADAPDMPDAPKRRPASRHALDDVPASAVPASSNKAAPVVARVHKVDSTGPEAEVQAWGYRDAVLYFLGAVIGYLGWRRFGRG